MKLSEKIATMVWAFASGDSRQHAVRQIAREVEDLEVNLMLALFYPPEP